MILGSSSTKFIIIAFLIISMTFLAVAQLVVWGSLDIETKIGPAKANLEADFYEHGVNYVITGNTSGGIIGGIVGIGGVGGSDSEVSIDIRENKTFLTGLGDFQENIGLILDSYKDKRYFITTSIWNNETNEYEDSKISVITHINQIPWWAEGVGQKCSVEIILEEMGIIRHVEINNIEIILWRDFDHVNQLYSESSEPIATKALNDQLSKRNESKTYDFDITINKDYGRVGIIGVVDLTIIDSKGNEVPQNNIINLGKTNPLPAARTNNIYTMDQGRALSIVLLVAAFPMTIITIILIIIALPLLFNSHRWSFWLVLSATILAACSVIFYMNGIITLVDMLDSVLVTPVSENFSWSYTLALPFTSVGLLIAALILIWITRTSKTKPKEPNVEKKVKQHKAKKGKLDLPNFKTIEKPIGKKNKGKSKITKKRKKQ